MVKMVRAVLKALSATSLVLALADLPVSSGFAAGAKQGSPKVSKAAKSSKSSKLKASRQIKSGKAIVRKAKHRSRPVVVKAGEQLPNFAVLQDDGSTACGNWIYAGCWTQAGNMTARRDTSDPSGLGVFPNWGFAWPANRRILYNRASSDPQGKPWDPEKKRLVWWNGKAWTGTDVPDFKVDSPPEAGMNPFIMNPEGVARFFASRSASAWVTSRLSLKRWMRLLPKSESAVSKSSSS